ncbi:MAG: hypothetical protein ACK42C_04295 [Aquificaceae bacterium]|jgi:hypothetical protein
MGIFIEDLLNFGNLIDAELEIRLTPEELRRAYPGIDFEIGDGIFRIIRKKKVLFLSKTQEIRLSDADGRVRKDRENSKQWALFRLLSRDGLEDIKGLSGFMLEGEYLGMDMMPAVVLTDTYEKIPKQFRDKLLINRYKIGRDYISVFFKFEK